MGPEISRTSETQLDRGRQRIAISIPARPKTRLLVGIIMGVASGAAMLPYTVIKEANPPELGGSATGVINFINFTFSAFLGPVFGSRLVQVSEGSGPIGLEHYQAGFAPLLFGVSLALTLTCFLKETGPGTRKT